MDKIDEVKIKEGKEYRIEKKRKESIIEEICTEAKKGEKNIIEMRLDENVKE